MAFCGVAHAKMPAAGYQIQNEAFGEFTTENGEVYTVKSQAVSVQIIPVLSAILTPANDLLAIPNQIVYWQHLLTNTGNADDSYSFNLVDVGGDSGVLKDIKLIHDVNKNGIFDAADVIIDPHVHIETVLAEKTISILVQAQIPAAVLPNSVFSLTLTIKGSQTDSPVLIVKDNAYSSYPQFELVKNVDRATLNIIDTDKVLKYSLMFSNVGNIIASGTLVNIEGVNAQKVVFEDPLPAGVQLKTINYSGVGGDVLYHQKGEPDKVYHRYNVNNLPALTQIDRVAIAYNGFDVQQKDNLDIEVVVNTSNAIVLNNQFTSFYKYGLEEKEAFSNTVSTQLLSNQFTLSSAFPVSKKPNDHVIWQHTLTNTGNLHEQYKLTLIDGSADSGLLNNIILIADKNDNGIYEPNIDQILTPNTIVDLDANQKVNLLAIVDVPLNAKLGDKFNLDLTAESLVTQLTRTVTDVVNIVSDNAQFTLTTATDLIRRASQLAVWPHTLKNTGSIVDQYSLTIEDVLGDAGSLDNVFVAEDTNNNGIYDSNDKILNAGDVIQLNAGNSTLLFTVATLPATAQPNDTFKLDVNVRGAYNGTTRLVTDVVKTIASPIDLLKQVDQTEIHLTQASPVLRYTLTMRNQGQFDLKPISVTVDNVLVNAVVMEDVLPTGLLLKGLTYTGSNPTAKLIYHLKGEPQKQYYLYPKANPLDASQVDAVGLVVNQLAPNQLEQFLVDATVTKKDLGTVFNNSFTAAYVYATVNTVDQSNSVSSVILSYQAQLTTAPVLTLDPAATAIWPHTLTNSGNLTESYNFAVTDVNGDSGLLENTVLIHDVNKNGVIDPADKVINASYQITLQPNESAALLVKSSIPATAQSNQIYQLKLTTTGLASGQQLIANDQVNIVAPVLKLIKEVDRPSIDFQDAKSTIETLTYTLTAENIGTKDLTPINIKIDGQNSQKVVFKDVLPANVWLFDAQLVNNGLKAVEYAGGGRVLYRKKADTEQPAAEHEYFSYDFANPPAVKTVEAIVIAHDKFVIGQKDQFKLRVNVFNSATGAEINNILHGYYFYDTEVRQSVSQKTPTTVKGSASLQTKNKFYDITARVALNGDVYLEAKCAQCNVRPDFRDRLFLEISSRDSGDVEQVMAVETGVNTGVFRIADSHLKQIDALPTRSMFEFPVIHGNYIIETRAHDKLTATILWCLDDDEIKRPNSDVLDENGKPVSAILFVDPFGVVFDSQTNKPIAGAIVKLVLIDNGVQKDPEIFDDNSLRCTSPRDPNADAACLPIVTTGTDGAYRFPLVPPTNGTTTFYRLLITAPDGYSYPSIVAADELRTKYHRIIDVKGSYGGDFDVTPDKGPVELDVPMDPSAFLPNLFVQKSTSRKAAELGEFVDYTVTVKNTSISNTTATNVIITDTLPKGFSYVLGSARINKVFQDPKGGVGPVLSFSVGDIPINNDTTITYRAHIGVGALHGDGVNRVVATPTNGSASNTAIAAVKVTAGVFSQEAFVVGKVYTDCNRDGVQGLEEIGVPNVRLLLEDGTYVITDVEGKFNFYGLRPTTHVLKLDRTTLPEDVELIEQSVRNAGDPASRFVDLKAGEIHRADFAITTDNATCSGPAMAEIYARRNQGDKAIGELERELKTDLTFDRVNPSDVRSLPASGCINYTGNECGLHGKAKVPTLTDAAKKDHASGEDVQRTTIETDQRSLESYLEDHHNNNLDILNLKDGQVLSYAQTRILFKGVLGAKFELRVNDQLLDDKNVGIRMAVMEQRMEAREYIGINLKAGENRIVLKQFDQLGNVRGTKSLVVTAPANLAKLMLKAEQKVVEANGSNEVLLTVKLQDENGVPVSIRTPITLETTAGRFRATDLDPQTQGVQLFIEGGEFSVKLVSPTQASDAAIRVSSGVLKTETVVRFVPELRPMIAAGIIEGMVSFKNFDSAKVQPAYANDGFEAELQSLANSNDGKLNVGGRAAVFLKGKVKGEYLLTLAYDSNKEKDQRLFRDIRPDDYYPVYGDAAVRGFDAQSTSKLYVRLDKGRSYVMFGDYTTRIEGTDALSLGQYNRSLTGIRAQYATDTLKATTFVAQTKSKQIVCEIAAQGISGPYALEKDINAKPACANIDGLKVNSEKVEIIKRDRNNLGLIISTESQSRFTDYEFEALTSSLYFKAPVRSLDANLNPYSIRVTIEVEEVIGEDYWVGGVQAEQKLGRHLTVGAAAVQEDVPDDVYTLASANAVLQLGEATRLIAEIAQSDRETTDVGQASRAELQHTGSRLNLRLYYGESDTLFENPAAPLTSGRAESGLKATFNMNSWGSLITEAIRTNTMTGGVRYGVKATVMRPIGKYLTAELGGRFYDETAATSSSLGVTPYEGVTIHSKLNVQIPKIDNASLYGEYEQDIENADRKIIAVGGDYRINTQSKLYARHELASTVAGGFALNDQQQRNNTVIGVESNYMKDGRVFSEYRVRDAVNAEDVEAAIGLRNAWYLTEGLRLNTNFEEVRTLQGSSGGDAIAVNLGLEYLANSLWKASAKVDFRWADGADTILNTLGFAYKLSRDWTLLSKNIVSLTDNHNPATGNRLQNRFQLGAAYRQVDKNQWDMLTKVEHKLDDDKTNLTDSIQRDTYIFSNHLNYHPVRRWTFANQIAAKWMTDRKGVIESDAQTYLIGGRIIHDISERWETSVQAGWLSGDLGGQRTVLGAEVGYLVTTNLWVSGGYNWLSYDDADLVGTDFTVDGAYLRLRFKFDEDLFGANKATTNKALEPKNVGL